MRADRVYVFRGADVERGNGKPGYSWKRGYYRVHLNPSCSHHPGRTLSEWRAQAKRDGFRLVVCVSEEVARDKAERWNGLQKG